MKCCTCDNEASVEEIEDINEPMTTISTVGINYPSSDWKEKCEELLND